MEVIARIEKYLQHGVTYDRLNDDLAALVARARIAYTDPLTGVANRAGLVAEWPTLCTAVPTVAMLDLDRFKQANDRYGHGAGDLILIEVAVRLCTCGGRVARLGGDEFAMVLPCSLVRAIGLMHDLAAVVAGPIGLPGGMEVTVSASIGVHRATSTDLGMMLACADAAMYRAKALNIGVAAYNPHCDGEPVTDHRPPVRLRDRPPDVT